VTDNGQGFANAADGPGFGLIGMRERMRSVVDGSFDIRSSRNGVTIVAEVPLNGLHQAAQDPSFVSG
jgi:signal transduction histidine kinase